MAGSLESVTTLIELCQDMERRLKLLRDYAASPGDLWLARSELTKIAAQVAEVQSLLADIERSQP